MIEVEGSDDRMFATIEKLIKYWSTNGGKVNAGASEAELAAFEAKYDVRLPDDLRQTLTAVNGTDGLDEKLLSFRSLKELAPLGYPWATMDSPSTGYFEFADFLIHSHIYAIQLHREAGRENKVAVFYDQTPIVIADSFSDFVQAYLRADNSVLFSSSFILPSGGRPNLPTKDQSEGSITTQAA